MILPLMLACGGGDDTVAVSGPHAGATAAAGEALCKLFTGAKTPCVQSAGKVEAAGHVIQLSAEQKKRTETMGVVTLEVDVGVTVDGTVRPELTTGAVAYGGSEEEGLKRGFHEWAVVNGVVIVDVLLNDPSRPGLAALSRDAGKLQTVGNWRVFRGYSIVRWANGTGLVDHDKFLSILRPAIDPLPAGQWHQLVVQMETDPSGEKQACRIDGQPSAKLCELAKTYPWPATAALQVKQTYLLAP